MDCVWPYINLLCCCFSQKTCLHILKLCCFGMCCWCASWVNFTRLIFIPNGKVVAVWAYKLMMLLHRTGRVSWSTSTWIALIGVTSTVCAWLPLIVWNLNATSMPVAWPIVCCSACKLYSGAEKSSHPRHVVNLACGNCLCHISCCVSFSHVSISFTRLTGVSVELRKICGWRTCPACEYALHPGLRLTRQGTYVGMSRKLSNLVTDLAKWYSCS